MKRVVGNVAAYAFWHGQCLQFVKEQAANNPAGFWLFSA
jgi:hypothetical protein